MPLAKEKIEGPATSLSFLGILLDTSAMTMRLLDDKLHRLRELLAEWTNKKAATKRSMLSLIGELALLPRWSSLDVPS